jgi:phage/plasmid primase-like uncharacterized protein
MVDITDIFGGPYTPPPSSARYVDPPEAQLAAAMLDVGITPPDHIELDGRLHRFQSGTRGKPGLDRPGWYVAWGDGVPAGSFGCWRAGIEVNWRAETTREHSPADEIAYHRRIAESKAIRDAELKRSRENIGDAIETIWTNGIHASADHPYLKRKGIQPHGARITGDGRLMVPLYSANGELASIQYIGSDGDKKYHAGCATGGKYWLIGEVKNTIYIAEGFATAATIHEATGEGCVVAYSASNLPPVTEAIRQKYGATQNICIVADNDASQVGQKYADQASAKYGVRVVIPPIPGDANDYHLAGNDLKLLLTPQKSDWLVSANDLSKQPAPIKWLIKNWIQEGALEMIHAPAAAGKTFMWLDQACCIASNKTDWFGNKVKNGFVVALVGEGHWGLRSRIAAWKQENKVDDLDMYLSTDGCDLNTPAGYMKVVDNIRALGKRPLLIVIDTMHRFLFGDENSAKDAKSMIDAIAGLQREFGCAVIIIHHTGVSEEAQHRARGSSAWRGAVDIEVSLVPSKNESPIEIIMRKSKDSEIAQPLYAELKKVTIEGWVDEDGEPVTSAVFCQVAAADMPVSATKKDKSLAKFTRLFERAWYASGCERDGDSPYVSRSSMINFLTVNEGMSDRSAEQVVKSSAKGKLINRLIDEKMITEIANGWSIIDQNWLSAVNLSADFETPCYTHEKQG